jgi:hypothetical protein
MRLIATFVRWLKTKTSHEKKKQPQNARGSKQSHPMKKKGNPKIQGAQNKDLR